MNINTPHTPLFGETGGQHPLAALIDHTETYGPHVIKRFAASIDNIQTVVDLGAGSGRDLEIIKAAHPTAKCIAIEGGREYAASLREKVEDVIVLDIERDQLPFLDESIDLVIVNQVLEHTKEVFWIFHEVTRSLKVGGYFLFGVPNVASFHNRLLLLFGIHPTQHKLCSAHVRPFSKADTMKFVNSCFPGGYSLAQFAGAQFYPFPSRLARPLANVFPTAAFSIFFLLRKERVYINEFATYPTRAKLETNFWRGNISTGSQY